MALSQRQSIVELVWMGNSFGVKCAYCVIVRRNSQMNSGSILSVDDGDEA